MIADQRADLVQFTRGMYRGIRRVARRVLSLHAENHSLVPMNAPPAVAMPRTAGAEGAWRRDLAKVLRRYGLLGIDGGTTGPDSLASWRLQVINTTWREPALDQGFTTIFVDPSHPKLPSGISVRQERSRQCLFAPRRFWLEQRAPQYFALLPFVSFSGPGLTPIWTTKDGRTVIGWLEHEGRRQLIVGLDVVEEIIRFTQGDPEKVVTAVDKTLWGDKSHERASYLFADHIVAGHEHVPWADRLGFTVATAMATEAGLPLISPLPDGAAGGILLTGDDDQAWLEKYAEQQEVLAGFPISYLMLPHTKHNAQTLAAMDPAIEFGVHVDALEHPEQYASICREQTDAVRRLVGRPARSVRNHGHLNDGYWGHLAAWEACGLTFDLNIRGIDGTCPTGSYLPFEVRRIDGSWSAHYSLFSTFSDSMFYMQKWPAAQQIKCIGDYAKRIEKTWPGVIVVNLHPQNVSDVRETHKAVADIGRRPNWKALRTESYIDWIEMLEKLQLVERDGRLTLQSPGEVKGLALTWPGSGRRQAQLLPVWSGSIDLDVPGR